MAPNGAVMRTSALGVHRFHDIDHVTKNAAGVAKITHFDPRFSDTLFFICSICNDNQDHVYKNALTKNCLIDFFQVRGYIDLCHCM